jgi:hypothetical protein
MAAIWNTVRILQLKTNDGKILEYLGGYKLLMNEGVP